MFFPRAVALDSPQWNAIAIKTTVKFQRRSVILCGGEGRQSQKAILGTLLYRKPPGGGSMCVCVCELWGYPFWAWFKGRPIKQKQKTFVFVVFFVGGGPNPYSMLTKASVARCKSQPRLPTQRFSAALKRCSTSREVQAPQEGIFSKHAGEGLKGKPAKKTQ